MDNEVRIIKSVTTMFAAFDKADEKLRIGIYVEMLKEFPADAIDMACKKAILESKFLPSIAELVANLKDLAGAINEEARVKTWEEAWGEIQSAMYSTQWGKTPKWSTPEIASAVNAFGWHDLHTAEARDMATIRAQIRRFYDEACQRISNKARNEALLGNGGNILGIGGREEVLQIGGHNENRFS